MATRKLVVHVFGLTKATVTTKATTNPEADEKYAGLKCGLRYDM